MSDRLKALREQRAVIVTELRAITDKAGAEKRDLSGEELAKHTELCNAADAKRQNIEAEERSINAVRDIAEREAEKVEDRSPVSLNDHRPGSREYRGAIAAKLIKGDKLAPEERTFSDQRMSAFRGWLQGQPLTVEERTLQAGVNVDGGFLVPPPEFVAQLVQNVDNMVMIRQKATKFTVLQADSLGVPTLDTDLNDFDWTTELLTGSEDTAMKFGKRELTPHPFAKLLKVSKTLMRKSALPVDQIVAARLAYKSGVTQEKAFMTGNGVGKPLGVFTASSDGIGTGQDVSTSNTTTAMTADGLINAKMSLKAQYWSKGEWIFHRDGFSQISKLKDGDGQYLWRMSISAGEPDTLLGRPVNISEYAPNTFTTGLYVGIFGDFSNYWIVDCLDLQVQRLIELYAATNQDGFIGRLECDGMPILAEAFARVKLA